MGRWLHASEADTQEGAGCGLALNRACTAGQQGDEQRLRKRGRRGEPAHTGAGLFQGRAERTGSGSAALAHGSLRAEHILKT